MTDHDPAIHAADHTYAIEHCQLADCESDGVTASWCCWPIARARAEQREADALIADGARGVAERVENDDMAYACKQIADAIRRGDA